MPTIPQRDLRNRVSDVLRRAEAGERFTVTVDGRPVAELGPTRLRRFASGAKLAEILADTPVDPDWAGDLERMREAEGRAARDPWTG